MLPPPPHPEPLRLRDPAMLAPGFKRMLDPLFARMVAVGFDPIYGECVRTEERQAYLYGFGRDYDDGRGIVTNVRHAYDGWHFYGLAADIWDRALLFDPPPAFLAALGRLAQELGLTWGGDWNGTGRRDEHFVDADHVQFGRPMLVTPSPHAWQLFTSGGRPAVWAEVGAL